jgi:prevent-host-death family protein
MDKPVDDWLTLQEKPMAKVSAFEAKTRFGELLERVSRGEEVVITRHGKPVARLVPEGATRLDDVRRAVAGLRELQREIRSRSRTSSRAGRSVPPSKRAGCEAGLLEPGAVTPHAA